MEPLSQEKLKRHAELLKRVQNDEILTKMESAFFHGVTMRLIFDKENAARKKKSLK